MRHRSILSISAFIASLLLSTAAIAAAAKPCPDPAYWQFDFWVGTWDVTTPDGKTAGWNRIEKDSEGCALVEHWTGARGGSGTSLNFYEASTRRWNQIWVDNEGAVLRLSGGLHEGRMVLSGTSSSNAARQRITWTPLDGGRVRQHWETSDDGGRTWKTAFDGTYSPRPSSKTMM